MSDSGTAWLLPLGPGRMVATALHEVIEVIPASTLVALPGCARHCRFVTLWQEGVVPVMDLGVLLGTEPAAADSFEFVAVLAWQDGAGQALRYGGVLITAAPAELVVNNDQMRGPPDARALWSLIALSCFEHQEQAVPILNVSRLYTTPAQALLV